MEKTEWPTRGKLEELREQGIVVRSEFSIHCASALGFLLGLWIMRENWRHIWNISRALLSTPFQYKFFNTPQTNVMTLSMIVRESCMAVITPVILAAVCALLVGFLETRFFFQLNRVALTMSRLNPFRFPGLASFWSALWLALLIGCVCLLLGGASMFVLSPRLFQSLNERSIVTGEWYLSLLTSALGYFTIVLLLGAVIGYLCTWFQFMMQHRMSKREIEEEGRE